MAHAAQSTRKGGLLRREKRKIIENLKFFNSSSGGVVTRKISVTRSIVMNQAPTYVPESGTWICGSCRLPLEQVKGPVFYLNSAFDVYLPRCPKCGQTLVPKSLAEGKMLEVETLLEDK